MVTPDKPCVAYFDLEFARDEDSNLNADVDGEQCGNAPTPALIPQIDMYVWTGGSLYFAM